MIHTKINKKILSLVKDIVPENMDLLIDKYPFQRFGQIICNYICPDYRDYKPSKETIEIMSKLAPKNFDFFFEEPLETYRRLNHITV